MTRYLNRLPVVKLMLLPLLLALTVAFFCAPRGGRVKRALFHLGISRVAEEAQLRRLVRTYNAATQGSYATAGLAVEELAVIPAYNLEKRRIYKDINLLRLSGKMVVFDKDKETIEKVTFVNRDEAFVTTSEMWVMVLQDFATRRKLTNLKASQVQCRYHLLYHEGVWKVERAEVFPVDEKLPPLNVRPVL
jgi:hypothetical protein